MDVSAAIKGRRSVRSYKDLEVEKRQNRKNIGGGQAFTFRE